MTLSRPVCWTERFRGGWFSKKTPGASSAYDPITQRFFRPTHDRRAIEVLDIEDPDNPHVAYSIDMNPYGGLLALLQA